MTIYGYARVSTDGQTLDAQQAALRAAGAELVFAEKISGAVTDRKALARLWGLETEHQGPAKRLGDGV
jgi:DNA invertase Pin-like site-specific DNA recombinase